METSYSLGILADKNLSKWKQLHPPCNLTGKSSLSHEWETKGFMTHCITKKEASFAAESLVEFEFYQTVLWQKLG